jgi:hypothetical protein
VNPESQAAPVRAVSTCHPTPETRSPAMTFEGLPRSMAHLENHRKEAQARVLKLFRNFDHAGPRTPRAMRSRVDAVTRTGRSSPSHAADPSIGAASS